MNKQNFRIVFMGTPQFAVASLQALVAGGFNIVGVVTAPDKPAGRGQKMQQSAVKQFAVENELPVLQPTNLKDAAFQTELKSLNADLQIIVAFRMLPEAVWNMPRLGSINLHASLLPNYRGAAPINWAIINGEKYTGVTTFFLKHEIDTGDIIDQEQLPIEPADNAGIIHDKLMMQGAITLVKTTQKIIDGKYSEVPQEKFIDNDTKHAPKIFKTDCKINWLLPAGQIQNLVRGLSPYPAAWATLKDKNGQCIDFKIFESQIEITIHNLKSGTIVSDGLKYIKIAVNEGFIILNEIQISGKKRMPVDEFLRGFKNILDFQAI